MRPALLAVLLATAAASAQPASRDSVPRLPAFSVPVTGDFAPPQTSAARAYLYSAAATAVPIAVGALLLRTGEPSGEPGGVSLDDVGFVVALSGVWFGPLAGNLSLGAGEDARRAFLYSGAGFLGGVVLAGVATAIAGGCVVSDLARRQTLSSECVDHPVVVGLVVTGAAVAAAGALGGAGYALGTVPRNAARARLYREAHPRLSAAPGWRSGGPALTLRVDL